MPADKVKAITESHGSQWTEATSAQWQFLRGISALNPATPPGLPSGDKAAIAVQDGKGVILFLDDDQVCLIMQVPKQLLDMLDEIASGKINHEGKPL